MTNTNNTPQAELTHSCANCSTAYQGAGCPVCRLAAPAASAPTSAAIILILARTLGQHGAAFDPPGRHRAYTYQHQPGNGAAYRLGKACDKAAAGRAGDFIDRGLGLLKELQEVGYGVFDVADSAGPVSGMEDDDLIDLGGTAPRVPAWLVKDAARISDYMAAHHPGAWAIGGIQRRTGAALASAPVAVPAGHALVPLEPTPGMVEAGATERVTPHVSAGHGAIAGYKAMLAAAPVASARVAGEAVTYLGDNVAERLESMADDQPPGSQTQSDLYAAATIWRKHIAHSAALASAAVAGKAQQETEQMAVNRYRPVLDGMFGYKVVAGDGTRSLYTGTKDSCLRVAEKLTEAFLDGAFVASNAAPQASAEAFKDLVTHGISIQRIAPADIRDVPAPTMKLVTPPSWPGSDEEYAAAVERGEIRAFHRVGPVVAAPQASAMDFADAYEGAREDLAIWKRRAMEAERDLRAERETSSRLVAELNAQNGPTRMGEPAPQASADAVSLDDVKAIAKEVAADSAAIRAEARNAALEEAATLMDVTSRSSGAALIRGLKQQRDYNHQPLLAAPHTGMRVDYRGLFRQARAGLHAEPGLAEMLRQLQDHLQELGQRWYAGDMAVVDELLQLYGIESKARASLAQKGNANA